MTCAASPAMRASSAACAGRVGAEAGGEVADERGDGAATASGSASMRAARRSRRVSAKRSASRSKAPEWARRAAALADRAGEGALALERVDGVVEGLLEAEAQVGALGAELVEEREHAVDGEGGDAAVDGGGDPPAAAVLHQLGGGVAVLLDLAADEGEDLVERVAADAELEELGHALRQGGVGAGGHELGAEPGAGAGERRAARGRDG